MINIDGKFVLTLKDIVKDVNPNLRMKSTNVTFPLSTEYVKLIEDMENFIHYANDEKFKDSDLFVNTIGIAAPQIGKNIRIILVRLLHKDLIDTDVVTGEADYQFSEETKLLINPMIVGKSANLTFIDEGEACLSVEKKHEGYVHRYYKISVKFWDFDGVEHTELFYGLNSIVIQHEIDHLDGILFYDHINQNNSFFIPENSKSL